MAQYLSEHLGIHHERLLHMAGIDQDEFNDQMAFDILEIPLPLPPSTDDDKQTIKEEDAIELIEELSQEDERASTLTNE